MKFLIPGPPAKKQKDSFKMLRFKLKVRREEKLGSLIGTGRDCADTTLDSAG